jgi:hypothetical protein
MSESHIKYAFNFNVPSIVTCGLSNNNVILKLMITINPFSYGNIVAT